MLDMWETQDWKCEHGNPVTSMRYPNGCDDCEFTENVEDEWTFDEGADYNLVYRNGVYWDDVDHDEEPRSEVWATAYNEWRSAQ